jgi:putative ATP-dependent endonuclease of OLD family
LSGIFRNRKTENYYSKNAIQRLFRDVYALPAEFQIQDYTDIKEEVKTHISTPFGLNFKAKNNFDFFE